MTRKHLIVLINIVICCATFLVGICIAAKTYAQAPSLPCQIYGKILNQNGSPVANVQISAYIDGNLVGASETNEMGEYGIAPKTLIISDPLGHSSGKTIEFSLNNVPAQQTGLFQNGILEEVNMEVSGVPVSESVADKQKYPPFVKNDSATTSSTSPLKGENEVITYTTPIFHIKKRERLSQYVPAHAPIYPHSKILGLTAGCAAFLIFFWVCLQNYLYAKRQNL